MTHNPLDKDLAKAEKHLKKLRTDRDAVANSLAWFDSFDPAAAATELAHSEADTDRLAARLSELKSELSELNGKTAKLKSDATENWLNPLSWFTDTRPFQKQVYREHLARVKAAESELAALKRDHERATRSAQTHDAHLTVFRTYDRAAQVARLEQLDAELPLREVERDDLARRKSELDARLKAPLAELKRCQSERAEHEATRERAQRALSDLDQDVWRAKRLDADISAASTSYDRAMLHKECERAFGNSRPGAVLRDLERRRGKLQGDVRTATKQLERIDRDISKIEDRLRNEAQRGSRQVKSLIIDGNNLCYQGEDFIRLAALTPLCRELETRFDVTVVFDASIRRLLGLTKDAAITEALGGRTRVHVVASRGGADETILRAADDPFTYVLSNDRFADYRDIAAVREERLVRHEILRGRVLVHDLGIDVKLMAHG